MRRRHAVVDGLGREALGEGASLQAGVIADVFGGGGEGFEQRDGSCRSGGMKVRRDSSLSCRNDSCDRVLTA